MEKKKTVLIPSIRPRKITIKLKKSNEKAVEKAVTTVAEKPKETPVEKPEVKQEGNLKEKKKKSPSFSIPRNTSKHKNLPPPIHPEGETVKDLRSSTQKREAMAKKARAADIATKKKQVQPIKAPASETSRQQPQGKASSESTVSMPFAQRGPARSGGAPLSSQKKSYKTTRKRVFINKKKQNKEKTIQLVNKKTTKALNPVPKKIRIMENITIAELAKKMNLKSSHILSKLMSMGTITSINSTIDYETAQLLADEYECEVELISLFEQTVIEDSPPKEDVLLPRPPVVTVMGHVDHGKTTLLDVLRGTNVADNEHGNITQHIGAYQIKANNSNASLITMLDTPGHFAFSKIRSRGAKLTDLIVLVVAVDDGVKPQTEESIKLALETDTPVIVALNKIDLPDYDEEKVFEELSEHNVLVEEWGGTVPVCRISALKKIGIENLLEHILFQAEVMELKASSKARARGTILESKVEKGRGPVLTVLIENGILRVGDPFVAGVYYGKVRSIYDDRGESIKEVMSGTPVEVVGVEESPSAGEPFQVTESEKVARQISINRQELDRHTASENVTKVTTDTLYSTIEADQIDYYNVIIKGDVHSSVEAVKNSLLQLGNNEVAVKVIQASTGSINENDIRLAAASNADVIGFNIKPASKVSQLAVQEKVTIKKYNLIHDIHEAVKDKLNEKLQPSIHEEQIAEIEVRELFKISKVGTIAGAMVLDGKAEKKAIAKVFRNNTELVTGTISSLKRNKDDVNSVEKGFECGVGISNFNDFQIGDIIQVYKTVSVKRTL